MAAAWRPRLGRTSGASSLWPARPVSPLPRDGAPRSPCFGPSVLAPRHWSTGDGHRGEGFSPSALVSPAGYLGPHRIPAARIPHWTRDGHEETNTLRGASGPRRAPKLLSDPVATTPGCPTSTIFGFPMTVAQPIVHGGQASEQGGERLSDHKWPRGDMEFLHI